MTGDAEHTQIMLAVVPSVAVAVVDVQKAPKPLRRQVGAAGCASPARILPRLLTNLAEIGRVVDQRCTIGVV